MSHPEKIPLKTFWEAVEGRLAAYSIDELRTILRAMARETPPTGRRAFLEKLKPVEETALTAQQAIEQEKLLAEIDDLAQELKATMAEAVDWEERYGWGGDYDEEDSLGPYEEFVAPLVDLFDRAEAVFDDGDPSLARAAYERLLEIVDLEDDYGRGVHVSDLTGVEMDEAVARYLRAAYETEPLEGRPRALFAQMGQVRSGLTRGRPLLVDLIKISPRPLPDREQFLRDWIAFLRTQSGGEADAWLREAVRLAQGAPGLEALARAEGASRPRAYLDWFTALAEEDRHEEVLAAAHEALQTLPADLPIRAAIADHLCTAAARLGETEALRAGRWQAFLAKPTLARLLDLWEAAPGGDARTSLMRQAAQHIRDYLAQPASRHGPALPWPGDDGLERAVVIDKAVLAHACLLAGEVEAAHQLAAAENVLGWRSSSNSQSLVVGALLVLLSGKTARALPPNLGQVWHSSLQSSAGFWYSSADTIQARLEPVYAELLSRELLSRDQQEQFLAWCLDVARRRAAAIVGNQHRKSYGQAATLTVACAEVLRLRGAQREAISFVEDIRARFPRHRAFQTELKTAIQRMERGLR